MDFYIQYSLHYALLCPLSENANQWVKDNLPNDIQRLGKNIYVENIFVESLLQGIAADGLNF